MQIHRYWNGPPNPGAWWTAEVIHEVLGTRPTDWTDQQLPVDVVEWLEGAAGLVPPHHRPRHRGNMVEWWCLSVHGGLWLDHDVLPLDDLGEESPRWAATIDGNTPISCALALPQHDLLATLMLGLCTTRAGATSACVSGDQVLARAARISGDQPNLKPIMFSATGRQVAPKAKLLHLWESEGRLRGERSR